MGKYIFDQYTLLHFAVGVICYFWNISFMNTFIIHTLFELGENTNMGMYMINHYIKWWPGGKPFPDSYINNVGDTIGVCLGWYIAYLLDKQGIKYNYY